MRFGVEFEFEMSRSIPTEDRISSLPDSILSHILSFLPTKSAAATSILSKRWNPLWLSVPTLRFDDNSFKNYYSFYKFISSVFLLRDIMLPVRSFHLKCSNPCNINQYDINQFVHAAVQRGGMENLILDIYSCVILSNVVKLPPSIFSLKTLVVLALKGVKVKEVSHVIVDLPRLKTLHLVNVFSQSVEYILKLLSKCPVLEELMINGLLSDDAPERLAVEENFECLPNLLRANISNFSFSVDVLFALCCRAKVLFVQLDMRYRWRTRYYQFPMLPNLTHMELILKNNSSKKWIWLLEVLKHCPKLRNLSIQEDSIFKNEVVDNWMDPLIVPECLSTQLKICLLKGIQFQSIEFAVRFAKYIIQNSKVLNTMSIKCSSVLDINVKYQMVTKLNSFKRASTTCKVLFD